MFVKCCGFDMDGCPVELVSQCCGFAGLLDHMDCLFFVFQMAPGKKRMRANFTPLTPGPIWFSLVFH